MLKRIDYFNEEKIKKELRNKAIRGGGFTLSGRMLGTVLQIASTVILARLLTPEDFGVVGMATSFSFLLLNVGLNGFTEAVIQEKNLTHQQTSALFWIGTSLSIVLAVIFMLASPYIARLYHEPRLVGICIALSFGFIFTGLVTQPLALMNRSMQFGTVTGIDLAASLISIGSAIGLSYMGIGYWAIVVRYVSHSFVTCAGVAIFCRWWPSRPQRVENVKHMIKYASYTFINFSVQYFSRNVDKMLLGWRHGSTSLGYYDRAYQLFVMPVGQLISPLSNVALATLSRLRDEKEKFLAYYCKALEFIAFIGFFVSGIMTVCGPDIIRLLLGHKWPETGIIFSALAPSIGVMLLYRTNGWLLLSLGKPKRFLWWSIFALFINALGIVAGLPWKGVGVAIGYSISFYVIVIPGLVFAGKEVGVTAKVVLRTSWRYFTAFSISAFAVWWIYSLTGIFESINTVLVAPLRIVIYVISYAVVYLGTVVVLYRSFAPVVNLVSLGKEMVNRKKK